MFYARVSKAALAVSLGLVLPGVAFSTRPVLSHSFYSWECCHDRDCGPIAEDLVRITPGGFFLVESGETIPIASARKSPDGLYHRCVKNPSDRKSQTLCLYAPPLGS